MKESRKLFFIFCISILTGGPYNSLSAQATVEKMIILFDSDSYRINEETAKNIRNFAIKALNEENAVFTISGHTDNDGSEEYNIRLSQKRTEAVSDIIYSAGIDKTMIHSGFFGETKPLNDNNGTTGKAGNRRVEITLEIIHETVHLPMPVLVRKPELITLPNGVKIETDGSGNPGIEVKLIKNTEEMLENNIVTMTTEDEPLVSNVMFCVSSTKNEPCELKVPVKIYVPVSTNPYCSGPAMQFYDGENKEGKLRWNLLDTSLTVVEKDGQEFFEYLVRSVCPPCKNVDCKPKKTKSDTLIVKAKGFIPYEILTVFPHANAMIQGKVESNKKLIALFPDLPNKEEKYLRIQFEDGEKNNVILKIDTDKLKYKKKKGYYVIRKKDFRIN
ncbi:MAG: OmpA family protein [Bacteroidota bacterium]